MSTQNNEPADDEPYVEPNPRKKLWPEHWTPKQKEYWERYCQPVYDNLKTDTGRYWYRRTFRPKKQKQSGDSGVMTRDHVKLGTPEDYVAYNVSDMLDMWADLTGAMMREMMSYSVDQDELDEAVHDIVQAKVQNMSESQKRRVLQDAKSVAELYGL